MYSKRDWIQAVIIFLVVFVVFRWSPVHLIFDSRYQMLFSQQLLWERSFSVEARALPELQSRRPGQIHDRGVDLPYHLVQVGERFYSWFPPGTAILSMPYVAVANALGLFATDRSGIYDDVGEQRIEAGLAALLMAGLSVMIFLTSRLILSSLWSLLITAAATFGTPVWSTASRAVWSHTWGIFILGFVLWFLVRAEVRQARLRPVLLATCLSWLYFVRPTFSVAIVGITLYVLIYHRQIFLPFVITGCVWLAAFVGFSEYHFGELLPLYYRCQWDGFRFATSFPEGLAGSLISPARGLFVYVPIVIFVAYLLVRCRKTLRLRLAVLAASVICLHLLLISAYGPWHAGHSYGPRYSTDLVPWFALLGMLAVEARLRWRAANRLADSVVRVGAEWSVALLLLVCSVTLNGIGAIWADSWRWNQVPTDINQDLGRLWDWRHPPFLGMPNDSGSHLHKPGP